MDLLGEFQGRLVTLDEDIRVLQLGPGGLTMAAAVPLQADRHYDLQITIDDQRLTVRGRVVHMRTSIERDEVTYVSGMQFVDLPPAAAAAIAAFVERQSGEAGPSESMTGPR